VAGERHPTSLLSRPLARTLGFGLLALLGAAEWRRMIDGGGLLGTLGWVGAGILVAEAVRAAAGVPARWRTAAAGLATALGLVLATLVSGLEPRFLAPAHWSELADGIGRGLEALSRVTLPYLGADPWPETTVRLGGALLVAVAAALVAWPRDKDRGFSFLALAVLLVLVVTPVTAIGSPRSLMLGVALACLTVCFLWLDRMPLRPGAGAAVLGALVLAGALPLSIAADRDGPWFDYRAWAEGLGTPAPVRFNWAHTYEPITWPREGRELLRIESDKPHYWKLENLDDFDGERWKPRTFPNAIDPTPDADLDPRWESHGEWSDRARITVRGLRTTDLVGAGTTLAVEARMVEVSSTLSPGTWQADRELAAGDSYEVGFHDPRPQLGQIVKATSGADGQQPGSLKLVLPLLEPLRPRRIDLPDALVFSANLQVRPFAEQRPPVARYVRRDTTGSGLVALRNSPYWRTWRLAQRLKQGAATPYEFARRIEAYLGGKEFRYDERPPARRPGQALLDAFLFDSKAGYCQHFSGAMALLLRLGGVPARVATGFSPGGFNRGAGEWVVRDRDAHSWVEAWYDGFGWVTFDPTPAATPARSLIAALRAPNQASDANGDGGSVGDQAAPNPRNPAGQRRDPDLGGPAAATSPATRQDSLPLTAVALAVAALGALLTILALRRRRRRRPSPPPTERALADLVRALQRQGRPVTPGTTLAELERRLGSSRGGPSYLAALREARYRASGVPPSAVHRRALRRELAAGLGWRGRVQAWWALPPRLGRPPSE
jgi:hypothetical protein